MFTPRPYRDLADLQKMKDLLIEVRGKSPYSGYAHIGDLDWWVFYNPSGVPISDRAWLWDDEDGKLAGWAFVNLQYYDFDIFFRHAHWGTPYQLEMFLWMENFVTRLARQAKPDQSKGRSIATYASRDEKALIEHLLARGFRQGEYMHYFAMSLTVPLPPPELPEGYHFLEAMHPDWVEKRAAPHFSAFTPSKMTPERYRHFMTAPGYDPALDTVVVAPNGDFVAFAMGWIDPVNQVSIFEPVGTHQDYQRRGLGKAAILEGLRRLQARGIHTATVLTNSDDPGNIAFYQACGFEIRNYIDEFILDLPE